MYERARVFFPLEGKAQMESIICMYVCLGVRWFPVTSYLVGRNLAKLDAQQSRCDLLGPSVPQICTSWAKILVSSQLWAASWMCMFQPL